MTKKRTGDTPLDPDIVARIDPAWTALGASWRRSLAARNLSARTLGGYLDSHRRFGAYLCEHGMPQQAAAVKRAHVEAFIERELAIHAPTTAATHYRNLQQWWRWLLDEGEIDHSPMERMSAPALPDAPPPVLAIEEVRVILRACEGRDYLARRDTAIIRMLVDSGVRLNECAGILLQDVNLEAGEARVMGKRNRERIVGLGKRTVAALDRYQRLRAQHPHADDPHLWLGQRGALTDDGVYQIVRRRAEQAGLDGVYTHLFRHTFASEWLDGGGQEGDLMELAGWRSRGMLDRYGRSARSRRARDAHKRLSPGDRI